MESKTIELSKARPGEDVLEKQRDYRHIFGNEPNIYWNSYPMDVVEDHPLVRTKCNLEELSKRDEIPLDQLPQDTEAWDVAHQGIISSSTFPILIGLKSSTGAKIIKSYPRFPDFEKTVERSCGAVATYEEIQEALQQDIAAMKQKEKNAPKGHSRWSSNTKHDSFFTHEFNKRDYLFPKKQHTMEEIADVHKAIGKSQEPLGVLNAINYAHTVKGKYIFVGMATRKFDDRIYLGSSPDGVIEYEDGTREAVEVKTRSFFGPTSKQSTAAKKCKFTLAFNIHTIDQSFNTNYAQYQLHMYVGNYKAILVFLHSPIYGCTVVRLKRNDEWLKLALPILKHSIGHIQANPHNVDFDTLFSNTPNYYSFLDLHSKAISTPPPIAAVIYANGIQKSGMLDYFFVDRRSTTTAITEDRTNAVKMILFVESPDTPLRYKKDVKYCLAEKSEGAHVMDVYDYFPLGEAIVFRKAGKEEFVDKKEHLTGTGNAVHRCTEITA